MRYITSTAGAFEREDGDLRWRKKSGTGPWILGTWTPTLEDHPHLFCDQAEGTGINAPGNPGGSFAGDATVGDCLHWFQVNDLKPPKRPGGAK